MMGKETEDQSDALAEQKQVSISPSRVEHAFEVILNSPQFRGSEQCQSFLRYVVHRTLEGKEETLRERIIGCKVFGRRVDYDTTEDAIVRVRAGDVRKRLAQFYQAGESRVDVVIDIPKGSYVAHFSVQQFREEPLEQSIESTQAEVEVDPHTTALPVVRTPALPSPKTLFWMPWVLLILVTCGGLAHFCEAAGLFDTAENKSELAFWAPVLRNPKSVLIFLGTGSVYAIAPDYATAHAAKSLDTSAIPQAGDRFVAFAPGATIDVAQLVPRKDVYMSIGTVVASSNIQFMMLQKRKSFEVRYGGDLVFGDLHNTPSILVGAFNNPWTLSMTGQLRYVFVADRTIVDRQNKAASWTAPADFTKDYAIISRVVKSPSGAPLITIAGIGHSGTQAASEFLTQPGQLYAWTNHLPHGWASKNIQIVLETDIQHNTPVNTRVIAEYLW